MDLCPRCDAPNPEGYLFCGHCGATLPVAGCPSCGAAITDGQRFCGRCGVGPRRRRDPRSTAATAVEERKLATVLFADVVGFTSLAERTDPEVVARLVDTAFRELGDIVADHGGTVDKYMGDSVMAVFGVPLAHDDDAERAVAAAMAMRHLGGDLVFSIGVNSGEVMATAMGAGGGMTVIGDTVNVAARLEKAAGPGRGVVRSAHHRAGRAGGSRSGPDNPSCSRASRSPSRCGRRWPCSPSTSSPSAAAPPLVGSRRRARLPRGAVATGVPRPPTPGRRGVRRRRFGQDPGDHRAGPRRPRSTAPWSVSTYPAYGAMGGARVAADVIRQLGPVADAEVTARVRSLAGELDQSLQSIDPAGMHQEQLWALGSAPPGKRHRPAPADPDRRHAPQRRPDAQGPGRALGAAQQRAPC